MKPNILCAATLSVASTALTLPGPAEATEFRHAIRLTEVDSTEEVAVRRRITKDREVIDVASEALQSLLDDRDYLGYMVEHAKGRISNEVMDALVAEHVESRPIADDELRRKVLILAGLVGERLDTELVSAVFRCDFDQADRVLATWRRSVDG
jgi:hypothetical protein